jgi:hypothetical protein
MHGLPSLTSFPPCGVPYSHFVPHDRTEQNWVRSQPPQHAWLTLTPYSHYICRILSIGFVRHFPGNAASCPASSLRLRVLLASLRETSSPFHTPRMPSRRKLGLITRSGKPRSYLTHASHEIFTRLLALFGHSARHSQLRVQFARLCSPPPRQSPRKVPRAGCRKAARTFPYSIYTTYFAISGNAFRGITQSWSKPGSWTHAARHERTFSREA